MAVRVVCADMILAAPRIDAPTVSPPIAVPIFKIAQQVILACIDIYLASHRNNGLNLKGIYKQTAGQSINTMPVAKPSSAQKTMVKVEPSGMIDLTGGDAKAGVVDRIKRNIYRNGFAILVEDWGVGK
jgi:hypothetical protein